MKVFFDGSPRGGMIRTCVVVEGEDPVLEIWREVAFRSSGHAEWLAAREAVRIAASRAAEKVDIRGDYQNVIRHFDASRADAASCRRSENLAVARDTTRIIERMQAAGRTVMWDHVDRMFNPAGVHLDDTWGAVPD